MDDGDDNGDGDEVLFEDEILNDISDDDSGDPRAFEDHGLGLGESNQSHDSSNSEPSKEQIGETCFEQIEQIEQIEEEKDQMGEVEDVQEDAIMTLHQKLNSTLTSLHENTTASELDQYAHQIVDMLMQCDTAEQHSFMEQCLHICQKIFTHMNTTLYQVSWNDFLLALFRCIVERESQAHPALTLTPLETSTVGAIVSDSSSSGNSNSAGNGSSNDMVNSSVELSVSRQLLQVYISAITEMMIYTSSSTLPSVPLPDDYFGDFLCKLADLYMTPINTRNRNKLSFLKNCITNGTSSTALEAMNVLLLQAAREWKEQKTWLVNTIKNCLSDLWKSGKCSDQYAFFGKVHALIHQLQTQ